MRQLKITKSITNREITSLDAYLGEVSRIELLTPEEESQLAQKIRQKDKSAQEKLIKANLRFVVSVAKQYQHQGLQLSDLINEGNIGLIKAAQRFDETRGFKFISYAVWWIRQSILQAIAEHSRLVRLPLNQIGDINRIFKEAAILEQKLERIPSPQEVADALNISVEKVNEAYKISSKHISMDAPLIEDEDNTLADVISSESLQNIDHTAYPKSFFEEIQQMLATLTARERDVINLFFGIGYRQPLTLDEIAIKFNLTRERIRQIKEKAMRRLKLYYRQQLLKKYIG